MKKEEARVHVIHEWTSWQRENAGDSHITNMLLFYNWLQANRPEILSFRSSGDKWQVVRGWIQDR
jgi:hypothetical protein